MTPRQIEALRSFAQHCRQLEIWAEGLAGERGGAADRPEGHVPALLERIERLETACRIARDTLLDGRDRLFGLDAEERQYSAAIRAIDAAMMGGERG